MKIAMIGTGGIARRHLQALRDIGDNELVGHLSRSETRGQRAASEWGGTAFTDLGQLLDETRPDAVWVTVPPDAHGELELHLIDRHVPFFVEKPLSADRDTAHRVASRLRETDLVTGVGYQWRALDYLPEVRALLAARQAGLVTGSWFGSLPAPDWWRVRERSGGQMVEQATHLIDLARHLLGEATVLSAAESESAGVPGVDVPAVATATLRFERGALGVFTATSLLERTAFVGLRVVVPDALLTLTRTSFTVQRGGERREVTSDKDPFVALDSAFLKAVRKADPSEVICSYEDALRTHDLVFDMDDLARQGYERGSRQG